jgi:THO complex subunit 2
MEEIRKKYTSATTRSGPLNALTAAVLVNDDAPADGSDPAEQTGSPPKPPPEQRIHLLQALLSVGHMPPSLYFLGKFPWLAQYSPPIADLVTRIVEASVEDLYRQTQSQAADSLEGMEPETPARWFKPKAKQDVATLLYPTPPDTPSTQFVYFYPDWNVGLEGWTVARQVRELGLKWLQLVRGLGGRRVEVMVKICRIAADYFMRLRADKEKVLGRQAVSRADQRAVEVSLLMAPMPHDANHQPTDAEMQPWLEVLRISILPSLSASNVTAAFDVEVWRLLELLPYATRYSLYGEWRDSTTKIGGRNTCPVAAAAAADSTRAVKKALARVTATKSGAAAAVDRGPARSLAKLSHSNPLALWQTAVTQVKSYSNIGQFIIEAGRYMTSLSYDVATFTLVDTLSDDMASRMNRTGTGLAPWLESE